MKKSNSLPKRLQTLRLLHSSRTQISLHLPQKMEKIEAREKELDELERTFKQRVKEATKRRVQAEEKTEKVKAELKRYYNDPGYVICSGN